MQPLLGGQALVKTKKVEYQVLETQPRLVPFSLNLSCQLHTNRHGHAKKKNFSTYALIEDLT